MVYMNASLANFNKKISPLWKHSAHFVAMKQDMLKMIWIPAFVLIYIHGDNMSIIHNTKKPQSTLKIKQFHLLSCGKGVHGNKRIIY